MVSQSEVIAHKTLVDGTQITLHSHAGGTDTNKTTINLLTKQAQNIIGSTTEAVGLAASNLGSIYKYAGVYATVQLTNYATIRLIVDANNAAGQSGIVTVRILNVTNNIELLNLTFNSTTRAIYETFAAIAVTGNKTLAAQIKSSVTSDDPIFHSISMVLEK